MEHTLAERLQEQIDHFRERVRNADDNIRIFSEYRERLQDPDTITRLQEYRDRMAELLKQAEAVKAAAAKRKEVA